MSLEPLKRPVSPFLALSSLERLSLAPPLQEEEKLLVLKAARVIGKLK
jgi:hypothetical protein